MSSVNKPVELENSPTGSWSNKAAIEIVHSVLAEAGVIIVLHYGRVCECKRIKLSKQIDDTGLAALNV